MQGQSLYDGSPSGLTSRIQDVWHLEAPTGYEEQLTEILHQFDPIAACRAIDERLEQLAGAK
jgi:hypothetical protein